MDKTMDQLARENFKRKQKMEQLNNELEFKNQESRQVYFDKREELIKGVNKVSKAVGSTLGVKGRLVLFNDNGVVRATKDGVTVASKIILSDKFQNYGASLLLEAALKTAREVGDGTTTTTLLTDYILTTLKNLAPERSFYDIQKGMLQASKDVITNINNLKKEVDIDLLYKVAYTSSNNNKEIAESITSIYKDLPTWDIDVLFHKSDLLNDKVEVEFGYKIDHGASNITRKVTKNNVKVILLDYQVSALGESLGRTVISACQKEKSPVLFICTDYTEEFIKDIERQSRDYYIPMYAVKLDLYGRDAKQQMKDLEYATSAFIFEEIPVYTMGDDVFGTAKTVIFNSDRTNLLFEDYVDEYIQDLELSMEDINDEIEILSVKRRLDKLKCVTANYIVGGATPQEMAERYDRIEDAVMACNAAIKHGVILGGGVTYLKIHNILNKEFSDSDYDLGYKTVISSLLHLFNMLCENSFRKDTVELYDELEKNKFNTIFNFDTEKFEENNDISIYDTAATGKVAIEAAVSVASTILLTSAIIL